MHLHVSMHKTLCILYIIICKLYVVADDEAGRNSSYRILSEMANCMKRSSSDWFWYTELICKHVLVVATYVQTWHLRYLCIFQDCNQKAKSYELELQNAIVAKQKHEQIVAVNESNLC